MSPPATPKDHKVRPYQVAVWLALALAGALWYASRSANGIEQGTVAVQGPLPKEVSEALAGEIAAGPEQQPPAQVGLDEPALAREPVVEDQTPSELSGSVVDDRGEAIAGALVSWTSWSQEFTEYSVAKTLPPAAAIEARSLYIETDAQGRFSFEQAPPGLSDAVKSVLWVTQIKHVAGSFLLGDNRDSWPDLDEIVMQPGTAMAVLVREGGQAVSGAMVTQRASVHRRPSRLIGKALEVLSPLPDQPLLFLRVHESDAAGHASLAPMEFPQYVQAQHGELESQPWIGFGGLAIVLDLVSTFIVEGVASLPALKEGWGTPRVLISRSRASMVDELAAVPVRLDGSFGPFRVPLHPAESYIARLDGNVVAPEERSFMPPKTGEQVFLDFQTQSGSPLWFFGVDQDGEIIKDTEVSVHWESNGRRVEQHVRADDNGYVLVPATPPGEVRASISAPGYQTASYPPVQVPEPQAVSRPILMLEGGRIEGTCMRDDVPARDFEVRYWWQGNLDTRGSVLVRNSKDGRFVINSAPVGAVGVEALAMDYSRSRSTFLDVGPGSTAKDVILKLVAPRAAQGQVVAAGTLKPLPMAQVQLYGSDGYLALDPIGPPSSVAVDGSFEIAKLGPGTGVLLVGAPGRSSRLVHFRESGEGAEELGVIELEETQPMRVRILGGDPSKYSSYSLRVNHGPRVPTLSFSAAGVASFDEMSSGNYELAVHDPTGALVMSTWVILKNGEEWDVDFDFSGECNVTLQVVAGEGGAVSGDVLLNCTLNALDGSGWTTYFALDEQGRGQLNGVGPGVLSVWASTSDGSGEGIALLTITPDSRDVELEIALSSRPMKLRVVDPKGTPLAGISLVLYSSASPLIASMAQTGSDGECTFLLSEGADRATLTGSRGGVQTGVPFTYPGNGEDVVELVLDTTSALKLHLTGDDVSPEKLACRLFDPIRGKSLVAPEKPDADRQVNFKRIGPGNYRLQVSSSECWTVSQQVTVSQGKASATVELRRLGGLELKLRRSDGSLAGNVKVELICEDLDESVAQWIAEGALPGASLTTDLHGVLKLTGLPRGRYRWSCGGGSGKAEVIADTTEKKTLLLP